MNKLNFKKFLVIFLFYILLLICFIFVNYFLSSDNKDLLYKYQWSLHNDASLSIDKSKISISKPIDIIEKNETELITSDTSDGNLFSSVEEIDINIEKAWDIYEKIKNKNEIIVAVIDTGIYINHYELLDGIFYNKNEIINGIDDDGNGYIDDINGWNFCDNNNEVFTDGIIDSHGTHVAGQIISSRQNGGIKGICNNKYVKVLPIKILGEGEHGDTKDLVSAIKYAEDMGVSICNISLGTYEYNEELEVAIKNSNMLFVVACGNGLNNKGLSTDIYKSYPASFTFDNVLSVGNLMFDGLASESSNFGLKTVSVFAPGTYILSTIPYDKFAFQTGSSMAAPIVTAVAGMVMSLDMNFKANEVKDLILENVTKVESLKDKCVSGGYINAGKIFEKIIDKN